MPHRAAEETEIAILRAENARLCAELERYKVTASELYEAGRRDERLSLGRAAGARMRMPLPRGPELRVV